MGRIRRRIWVLMVVIRIAPLVSVVLAGLIASQNDCILSEADIHPCVVLGVDIGGLLAGMGIMGWFMLVSVFPLMIGLLGLALEAAWLILRKLRSR
ncbi:MAG: hypothetical protein ACK5LJ_10910 [Paracoccus sp. (in: a-proteobacteria)]